MSIKKYLIRAYLVFVGLFFTAGIASEPSRVSSGYLELILVSMLFPIFSTLLLSALASSTPPERRKSFWSYRWANFVMLFPGGFAFLMFIALQIFGFEDGR
jgi:hypothetical protein